MSEESVKLSSMGAMLNGLGRFLEGYDFVMRFSADRATMRTDNPKINIVMTAIPLIDTVNLVPIVITGTRDELAEYLDDPVKGLKPFSDQMKSLAERWGAAPLKDSVIKEKYTEIKEVKKPVENPVETAPEQPVKEIQNTTPEPAPKETVADNNDDGSVTVSMNADEFLATTAVAEDPKEPEQQDPVSKARSVIAVIKSQLKTPASVNWRDLMKMWNDSLDEFRTMDPELAKQVRDEYRETHTIIKAAVEAAKARK